MSRRHSPFTNTLPHHTYAAPLSKETVTIHNMGIMDYLRRESHRLLDPQGERWALFDRHSSTCISTGSLLRLTYRVNRSVSSPVTFTGVLLAVRRSPGNPTILVRGQIDEVVVEQIFSIFSPLLECIEVLRAPAKTCHRKLYHLRERPAEILELQRSVRSSSRNVKA